MNCYHLSQWLYHWPMSSWIENSGIGQNKLNFFLKLWRWIDSLLAGQLYQELQHSTIPAWAAEEVLPLQFWCSLPAGCSSGRSMAFLLIHIFIKHLKRLQSLLWWIIILWNLFWRGFSVIHQGTVIECSTHCCCSEYRCLTTRCQAVLQIWNSVKSQLNMSECYIINCYEDIMCP